MPSKPRSIVMTLCAAAVIAGAALIWPAATAPAQPAAEPPAQPPGQPAPKPPVHVMAAGDLAVRVKRDGRIESLTKTKVRFAPEAYSGSPRVLEVLVRSGAVKSGQPLVRLDPQDLDKSLRSARESLADGKRNLELARQERSILAESNVTTLERVAAAHRNASHVSDAWNRVESANTLKSADLQVQGQEYWLEDAREELSQLESMYKGTELATETKEIVLNRARRGVRMTEAFLAIAKDNLGITKEFRHPDRSLDIAEALKWTTVEETRAQVATRLSEVRSVASVESAERSVRDETERLAKLERDRPLADIAAPADGVISAIDLQSGDTVSVNQVIAELHDPGHLVVRFQAAEEDLRVLAPNKAMTITLPAFREVSMNGSVTELGLLGSPSGDTNTNFPCVVAIEHPAAELRIGQRCTVQSESIVHGALAVPRKAVESRENKNYCKVWRHGAAQEVEVVLGGGNETSVQVFSGLAAGDEVVMPEAEAKDKGGS